VRASERASAVHRQQRRRAIRSRAHACTAGRARGSAGRRAARAALACVCREAARQQIESTRRGCSFPARQPLYPLGRALQSAASSARARARRPPARAHRRGVGVGAAPQVGARELRVPRPLLDQRPGVPDEGRLSGERRSWWVRARCGCDGSMISKSRLERARGRGGNGGQGGGGDATEGPRAGSSEGACACVRVHVCACVPESATARCAQLAGCPRCSCSEQTCAAGSDA
jgi:hypothetical protein